MLRKVGESAWPISEKDAVVSIKDASYPIPFPQGLEFNSPAHGCWNIVHTGMLIPEAHQIYVCADNCMRGVVLTAAEMCEEDRFSFVIVEEQNLLSGNLEDVTIEGTADILRKLKEREEKTGQKMPKAILLFTVCIHHFIGCDLERISRISVLSAVTWIQSCRSTDRHRIRNSEKQCTSHWIQNLIKWIQNRFLFWEVTLL